MSIGLFNFLQLFLIWGILRRSEKGEHNDIGSEHRETSDRQGNISRAARKVPELLCVQARLGSPDFWDKIQEALEIPAPLLSYESEELIESITEDIEEYGLDYPCAIFYMIMEHNIVFIGYDFLTNPDDHELEGAVKVEQDYKAMVTNLGDALDLFENQDSIF